MELPPADAGVEAWPGPGHGQHRGDEARRADAAHRPLRGPAVCWGGCVDSLNNRIFYIIKLKSIYYLATNIKKELQLQIGSIKIVLYWVLHF